MKVSPEMYFFLEAGKEKVFVGIWVVGRNCFLVVMGLSSLFLCCRLCIDPRFAKLLWLIGSWPLFSVFKAGDGR